MHILVSDQKSGRAAQHIGLKQAGRTRSAVNLSASILCLIGSPFRPGPERKYPSSTPCFLPLGEDLLCVDFLPLKSVLLIVVMTGGTKRLQNLLGH